MKRMKLTSERHVLWHYVLFVYVIISICLTWPLIVSLNGTLFSGEGDAFGGAWSIWSRTHQSQGNEIMMLTNAPFGQYIPALVTQPVIEALVITLARLLNEIIASNLLVLLSFPLTALTTYLLLNHLGQNSEAAFIGGLIFGFCPGAVMHAVGGHLTFAFNMFIPLFLLALFYNREKRSWLSASFVGLGYALVTLNSLYFGYFSIFIALFFVSFDYVTLRGENLRKFVSNYLAIILSAFLVIIPFQYKILMKHLSTPTASLVASGLVRDFSNLIDFSARPLDYLLPSIDHPVFGRYVLNFSRSHLHGSNLFEQTLYIGVVPLLLCLAGFFLWSSRRDYNSERRYFLFFMGGAFWMFFLSMPPFITFWSMKLPTISYYMYKIAPMFRVYARFGILVNFFVACAAAVVLSVLSDTMRKGRYYLLVTILLPLLIFEYWSIPPHHARDIATPPQVYQWLAREPGDIIVAEYPMMKSDEASFYTYLFWQRVHRKRMVNGASPDNRAAWDFFKRVNDLDHPDVLKLLQEAGVKYIIVHKQMYREGEIPRPIKRYYPPDAAARQYNDGKAPQNSLLPKPYKVFGDDAVYELDNLPLVTKCRQRGHFIR